ncbi:hypothetical protein SAMD00023353_3200120 [Rosellinia necatrix]|uniref:Uncharacterized protein n=1 Tax=Rosellinia necatrix TaxID=77044 RepID=A0A1W2TIH2_ROSNE|nr:hypothetical protein SAMD00023353_3200120 [Rosellinia necatrix]
MDFGGNWALMMHAFDTWLNGIYTCENLKALEKTHRDRFIKIHNETRESGSKAKVSPLSTAIRHKNKEWQGERWSPLRLAELKCDKNSRRSLEEAPY